MDQRSSIEARINSKSAKQCWPLILVKAEVGHATVSAVVVDLVPTWSLDLDQDTELYLG